MDGLHLFGCNLKIRYCMVKVHAKSFKAEHDNALYEVLLYVLVHHTLLGLLGCNRYVDEYFHCMRDVSSN